MDVVQKLWGFCHVLRHEGIGYGEYIEQITFLLYLKMADEKGLALPKGCGWKVLRAKSGSDLLDGYVDMLRALSKAAGLVGDIYAAAQSRFKNPASLKQLVGVIDETEWTSLDVDIKAAAYEGLLDKAASEGKKGVGGFFTPRVLLRTIVRCVKPDPRVHKEFTICDPACGTGGFLVAAYEWLLDQSHGGALDRETAARVKRRTYFGQDIVELSRRLALMNLTLHGLEPEVKLGDSIYELPSSRRFDVVMMNPPFGTRGANQAPDRDDFTVATSNKQLNFIQHAMTILKVGGRAAIIVPDNCLFADQAGEVFKILTQDCDLHTVLRLPRGTFSPYSEGVKANVIFFTKGAPTEKVWIYDARTNVEAITKKDRPLSTEHFGEFERCFGADPNGRAKRRPGDSKEDRWRQFHINEIKEREFKLDGFKWLKDKSLEDADELPEPEELATDAIAELESAAEELNAMLKLLEGDNGEAAASRE